jgi:hypothetical protein
MLPPWFRTLDDMMRDFPAERAVVCGCVDPKWWWRLKDTYDDGTLFSLAPGPTGPRRQIQWFGACMECSELAKMNPTAVKPGRYVEFTRKDERATPNFI